jgi:hypothetical protein
MRIDSSGNLLVGATTARSRLTVGTASASSSAPTLGTASGAALFSNNAGTSEYGLMMGSASTGQGWIQQQRVDGTATAYDLWLQPSGGNVGIGTSSPSNRLDVVVSGTGDQNILGLRTTGGGGQGLLLGVNTTNSVTTIKNNTGAYGMAFYSGTGTSESMRIDSSGNLLVGSTTSRAPVTIEKAAINANSGQLALFSPTAADTGTTGISITKYANNSTTSQVFQVFLINQASNGSGQINANGANAAAFGAFSDSRLKENIADLPSQLANIMALRPVEFDYIESEGGGHQIGFIAQEVQDIYPDLVGERADGMLTLSDMNKNDARLIKAIQEMKAIIDAQASTITTLTDRITALETPTGTQA